MYHSGIFNELIAIFGLIGFVQFWIFLIGNPLVNYKKAPLDFFIKYLFLLKGKKYSIQECLINIEELGILKVFICGFCLNFWLSLFFIPIFIELNDIIGIFAYGINLLLIIKINQNGN
jgi:hypothetical protein